MTENDAVDRYAVVGHPVSHSLSPRIHAKFAEQTGQSLSYEAIELQFDGFAAGLRELRRAGYRGVNVTVPFKREAWEICDQLNERADHAGAANTLSFCADGRITGDNTDGIGLVRDLTQNLDLALGGRRVLIAGAGGAVRGVLGPILQQAPARITLINRTLARAKTLAADFGAVSGIEVRAPEDLDEGVFDLIINGTAAGIRGELPPIPEKAINANTVCYDMMYDIEANTAFVDWALDKGARRAFDGLGMLVEQAAAAFAIWRGVDPETRQVIRCLREA